MPLDQNTEAEVAELIKQREAINEKIGKLTIDPNHQVLKPLSEFSQGEEVRLAVDGQEVGGKVIAVFGDAERGFTYDVAISAVERRPSADLKKA